jgi:hypothetical protein
MVGAVAKGWWVMATVLADFVAEHRGELSAHCLAGLDTGGRLPAEDRQWCDAALADLANALRTDPLQAVSLELGATAEASRRGRLHQQAGHRITTLLRDFRVICDAVCVGARRCDQPISTDELSLMNAWFDGAVAASIDEYVATLTGADRHARRTATAMFAIEVGNATAVMRLVFDDVVARPDGVSPEALALLDRSLARIENLVTQHLADSVGRGPGEPPP